MRKSCGTAILPGNRIETGGGCSSCLPPAKQFFCDVLHDIISYRCIGLLSLGFFPSTYSKNIAQVCISLP